MSDIIINGETYEGVESITVNKTDGGQETFVLPDKVGTTVTVKDAEGNDVVLHTWDADTKLDKVTDEDAGGLTRVYAVKYTGVQTMMKLNPNAGPSQIVSRDAYGRSQINDPVREKDIANKKYVDEAVANAGGGGGKLYKRVLTFDNGYKIIAYSSDNVNVSAYTTKSEKAEHLAKYYTNLVCYFMDWQSNMLKGELVTSIYTEDPSGGMVEGAEEVAIYVEPLGVMYAYEHNTIETITEV